MVPPAPLPARRHRVAEEKDMPILGGAGQVPHTGGIMPDDQDQPDESHLHWTQKSDANKYGPQVPAGWRWIETDEPVPANRAQFDVMYERAMPLTPNEHGDSIRFDGCKEEPWEGGYVRQSRQASIDRYPAISDVFEQFARAVVDRRALIGVFLCLYEAREQRDGKNDVRAAFKARVMPTSLELWALGPSVTFDYLRRGDGYLSFGD